MATTLENTLENRNALKAQWLKKRDNLDETWKVDCWEWQRLEKEANDRTKILKPFDKITDEEARG